MPFRRFSASETMLRIKAGECEISVSASFFILVTLMLITADSEIVLISLFSSLFHELGHIVLMILFGEKIKSLSITCAGFRLEIFDTTCLSLPKETAVSLAGIAVNLVISPISLFLYHLLGKRFFLILGFVNLAVACFNILPVDCLDGGRALYYIILRFFSEETAQKVIDCTTVITVTVLSAVLIVAVRFTKANFAFIAAFIYLIILMINRFVRLK